MAYGVGKFPHISRNISRAKLTSALQVLFEHGPKSVFGGLTRKVLVLLVLASFLAFLAFADSTRSGVAGASDQQNGELNEEINRTLAVIDARPDYAGAWVKLSVLHEQMGKPALARGAIETAKELNPNF